MNRLAMLVSAGIMLAAPVPLFAQFGDSITLPNGQKVRATAPDGGCGKVNPNGSNGVARDYRDV